MSDQPSEGRRARLTLGQLSAVVAIVAIVAAALFPVLAQMREQSGRATCARNLKQISAAAQAYLQDYDETWVPWGGSAANPGGTHVARLEPYIRQQGVADPVRGDVWRCPKGAGIRADGVTVTYGYNYLRLGYRYTGSNAYLGAARTPAPLGAIERPAEMVAFVDGIDVVSPPYGVALAGLAPRVGAWHNAAFDLTAASGRVTRADPRSQVVVAWADGHVNVMRRSALTAPSDGGAARNDNLWDRRNPSPWSF